ncbi:iroquois-class homeodomain protein IRX-5 [Bubalus bubalis]|uniref:iroquois-class homeodomain protein IRX-5 n=1 Tax=Bubalus bubalis TaxID=89462 RepID=UPI001E1B651F|nr:iroquois-class homeodomain protein IRX-5 [Bubalus bubalis]
MFAAAAAASSSLATWQRQQQRRFLPQRRPHSSGGGGGGAPSPHTQTRRAAAAGGAAWALLPPPPQEHPAKGDRGEALALSSVLLLVLPPLPPPPGITRAPRSPAAALVAMMMMSRTVVGGGDTAGKGGSGAGTRAGHPRGGPSRCFLPPPPDTPRGRRLQESRARAGHGESMTRPVGTATWGGIGRSRGDRARLTDRHFTSCREGGGSRGNGLLQVADVLEEHLFLIINALSYRGQPGAQLVHLHSGAQAAWRSPMWSTADVCRRERRQSSELRTGFLLKATHGPPLHTAWERAGYMAAPNFNR